MPLAPSVDNYSLGKGVVYFDRLDANGNPTGELDLGNAPLFAVTPTSDSISHYESRSGIKDKDFEVEHTLGYQVKITLDEINPENLNIALRGDGVEFSTQSDGSVVNEAVTARLSRWVKLDYSKIDTSSVVITNAAGSVTYLRNTDYRVDNTIGRIFFISGGSISEGESVRVSYSYNAHCYPKVSAAKRSIVEGFLRFVGDPDVGPAWHVQAWRVKLKTDSDINHITEDWAQIPLVGEVLKDTANHPDDPFFTEEELSGDLITES